MFCHRYPTGGCTSVLSPRDNVASPSGACRIVRRDRDCQPRGGREPGSSPLVNICESPINPVIAEQAEEAFTLGPKGTWSGPEVLGSSGADDAPPGKRRDLKGSVTFAERGKPVSLPLVPERVSQSQVRPNGVPVNDPAKSECRLVTRRIGVELRRHHPTGNRADLPRGLSPREILVDAAKGRSSWN